MTKQETIQVLQSIEDRAIKFPNMTECDWVAIAAAKRHLQEEPVSDDLEEAAIDICLKVLKGETIIIDGYEYVMLSDAEECFKAGTNWQKEQMMKDAVEATCLILPYPDLFKVLSCYDITNKLKHNDKIKLIPIKED